jgi:hypothetical protein
MALAIALVGSLAAPLHFALEVGVGGAAATDRYGGWHQAPVVAVFVGNDAPFWVAGIRAMGVLGTPDSTSGNNRPPSNGGLHAWGIFVEGGPHTAGDVMVGLRLGAGLGRVLGIQCDCSEVPTLEGGIAPAFVATAEGRWRVAGFWIGLQLGGVLFTGVGHIAGFPGQPTFGASAESGLVRPVGYLILTLGASAR